MKTTDWTAMLRQMFADQKLSTNERDALKSWVHENITTEQDRGVARHELFELAREALHEPRASLVLSFLEDLLKVLAPIAVPQGSGPHATLTDDQAFFSPGPACVDRVRHRILSARRTADICVFTITDNRISTAIEEAHRRGLKIRIISDNEKAADPGSDIGRFHQMGIPVRVDRAPSHMHHKFAIFDDTRLLTGSYNWTRSAAEENQENLVDTGSPALITQFRKEFERLWEQFA